MKWPVLSCSFITAFCLLSCGGQTTEDEVKTNPELVYTFYQSSVERDLNPSISDSEYKQLTADNNQFAIKFFKQLFDPNTDSSVFSPYSLSSALGMTYAGAASQTQTEMATALEFNLESSLLHAGFNRSLAELEQHNMPASGTHPAQELLIVNALWPALGTSPGEDFLDTLASQYGAGVYALDYVNETEASRQAINDQVALWTQGYITDLLPKDSVPSETQLIITSSIYFFAPWESSFLESNTAPGPFNNLDGTNVEVPTMSATSGAYSGQTEDADFGAIPFREGALQMVFIQPTGDFTTYVENFSEVKLAEGLSAMTYQSGVVRLPKFKLESEMSAVESLSNLGMVQAFTERADFSPMNVGDVYIGDIKHKAVIDVNEAGTTAAAATAVVILPPSIPPRVLTVDRPFIFMIHDLQSNTILFMGHVASF